MHVRRGFSLLELLLTIGLLLSAAGLAMPTLMGRLERAQAEDEADRVLLLLLSARTCAIEAAQPVHIVVTGDPATLAAIAGIERAAVDGARSAAQSLRDTWARVELDADVRTQGTAAGRLAVFLPDGSAVVEGALHFPQAGIRIVIEQWSGLPRVQQAVDGEGESAHASLQENVDEAAMLEMPTAFDEE